MPYERDLNGQISFALKKSGFGQSDVPSPNREELPEGKIQNMVTGVRAYMRQERERYLPGSAPLSAEWKNRAQQYFPGSLLDRVRIVTLKGARIPTPRIRALQPGPRIPGYRRDRPRPRDRPRDRPGPRRHGHGRQPSGRRRRRDASPATPALALRTTLASR